VLYLDDNGKGYKMVNLHFDQGHLKYSAALLLITFLIAVKEIIEIVSTPIFPIYRDQVKNWCQWSLIAFTNILILSSTFLPAWVEYNMVVVSVWNITKLYLI